MFINHHQEYSVNIEEFDIKKLPLQPIKLFGEWYRKSENILPAERLVNSFCLSTVCQLGRPRNRWLLLKEFNESGFYFYTNYQSTKAHEIKFQPYVALTFYWLEFHRQIRIEGKCKKISTEKSNKYFYSRPFLSQISAVVSDQSKELKSRAILKQKTKSLIKQYEKEQKIPRPLHWGGYQVIPNYYEFWQGRQSRLHERVEYSYQNNNNWKIKILQP